MRKCAQLLIVHRYQDQTFSLNECLEESFFQTASQASLRQEGERTNQNETERCSELQLDSYTGVSSF